MPKTLSPHLLLPHSSRMCLIESVELVDDNKAVCILTIKESDIFYDNKIQGVYNWFGIEFMAQSVGIYAGYHSQGAYPEVGLLLSVRKFKSTVNYFGLDETLIVTAEKSFIEDKIGVFNCNININDNLVCQARLNTYLPPKEQISQILTGSLKL